MKFTLTLCLAVVLAVGLSEALYSSPNRPPGQPAKIDDPVNGKDGMDMKKEEGNGPEPGKDGMEKKKEEEMEKKKEEEMEKKKEEGMGQKKEEGHGSEPGKEGMEKKKEGNGPEPKKEGMDKKKPEGSEPGKNEMPMGGGEPGNKQKTVMMAASGAMANEKGASSLSAAKVTKE